MSAKKKYLDCIFTVTQHHSDRMMRVLDVGTGVGSTTLCIARELPEKHSLVTMDIDRRCWELGLLPRLRESGLENKVRFVNADVRKMDVFPDASFDMVCMDTVVNLLGFDLLRAMDEVHRVLKLGGYVMIRELREPDLDSISLRTQFWMRIVAARTLQTKLKYVMLPSAFVRRLIESMGFDVDSMFLDEIRNWKPAGEEVEYLKMNKWYPFILEDLPYREAFLKDLNRLCEKIIQQGTDYLWNSYFMSCKKIS